jgi:glutamate racemase
MGPIGVFDSGLGGLTVLRALQARLPVEDFIYFGDTARVPYGTKGAKTVKAFARQDAAFLSSLGVKMIVVACNTASAFALDYLRESFQVPILGVIEPGVQTALACTRGGAVGVIGTSGTIRSGRYQAGLSDTLPAERIVARECPLFVPLVEEGKTNHPITRLAVAEYLTPLKERGVDTLILGCTHYPVLKPVIGEFMGPEVTLVDSADALAETAARRLAAEGLATGGSETEDSVAPLGSVPPTKANGFVSGRRGSVPGRLTFYLSDIPWKFAEIGERFLGGPIEQVTTVNLDEAEFTGSLPI